ncbi:MAG: ATP-binding protein [Luminiphilus sp.]|nr:ATP-binding protein [Luminiphilus sp.]
MTESFELLAEVSRLGFVQEKLENWWCDQALPEDQKFPFELVLEELFVNVGTHGNLQLGAVCTLTVSFECERADNICKVNLALVDNAPPFNPLDAEIDLSGDTPANKAIGGLGIHLTRTLMDNVHYEFSNGCNHIRVSKTL